MMDEANLGRFRMFLEEDQEVWVLKNQEIT